MRKKCGGAGRTSNSSDSLLSIGSASASAASATEPFLLSFTWCGTDAVVRLKVECGSLAHS